MDRIDIQINENDIIGFIHCADFMLCYTYLDYLHNIGLFNKTNYLFVCNLGYELSKDDFNLEYNNKLIIINISHDTSLFELPTINLIRNLCIKFNTIHFKLYYLHTKGSSYLPTIPSNIIDWIDCMLYYTFDKYNDAIKILDTYDTYGMNYLHHVIDSEFVPHYSGNFWWANSHYIKTLDEC